MRKRIHRVARDEGYLFSDITQGLITGWSDTIGMIVPRLTSPFVSASAFDLITPALSAVEQYPDQWGTAAVDIRHHMVASEPMSHETFIEPKLFIRESRAKVRCVGAANARRQCPP